MHHHDVNGCLSNQLGASMRISSLSIRRSRMQPLPTSLSRHHHQSWRPAGVRTPMCVEQNEHEQWTTRRKLQSCSAVSQAQVTSFRSGLRIIRYDLPCLPSLRLRCNAQENQTQAVARKLLSLSQLKALHLEYYYSIPFGYILGLYLRL